MLLINLNVYKIVVSWTGRLLYCLLRYTKRKFGESRFLTNETAV